jgi:hypothetical protein
MERLADRMEWTVQRLRPNFQTSQASGTGAVTTGAGYQTAGTRAIAPSSEANNTFVAPIKRPAPPLLHDGPDQASLVGNQCATWGVASQTLKMARGCSAWNRLSNRASRCTRPGRQEVCLRSAGGQLVWSRRIQRPHRRVRTGQHLRAICSPMNVATHCRIWGGPPCSLTFRIALSRLRVAIAAGYLPTSIGVRAPRLQSPVLRCPARRSFGWRCLGYVVQQ